MAAASFTQNAHSVRWTPIYGWRQVPVYRKSVVVITDGGKPEVIGYAKQFSHSPGALLAAGKKSTSDAGTFYVVRADHSLRSVIKPVFDFFASVPPAERLRILTTHGVPE